MSDTPTVPGYRSFGFYLAFIATALGALTASGAIGDGTTLMTGAGFLTAALASMGYATARAWAKSPDGKPNYKKTEFWMACAAVVIGALVTCGVFGPGSAALKILTGAGTLLGALGYTYTTELNAASAGQNTLSPPAA